MEIKPGDLVVNQAEVTEPVAAMSENEAQLIKNALKSLGYRFEFLGHHVKRNTDLIGQTTYHVESFGRLVKINA